MTDAAAVPPYVYVTYVGAAPARVWEVLTSADHTAQYWAHANVSDWRVGSRWDHVSVDNKSVDVTGRVLVAEVPTKLQLTFESPEAGPGDHASVVTFHLEGGEGITRVVVTHEQLASVEDWQEVAHGWPAVMANLKTMLETKEPLPQRPWEMPRATW